jgi:hypothetical protein
MLQIARLRAEAEDLYGMKLAEIGPATDRITGGFSRDDGASVRKVGHLFCGEKASLTSIGIRWCSNGDGRGSQEPSQDRSKYSRLGHKSLHKMV